MFREKVSDISDILPKQNNDDNATLSLIRADLLRKTALFDELLEKDGSAVYEEELLNCIIGFQKEPARRKCTLCMT